MINRAKLNALVHLHVFKGVFTRECTGQPDKDGFCNNCNRIVVSGKPHAFVIPVPDYARDIHDAWRIVTHYNDVQMHYMSPGTNHYGGTNLAVIAKHHRGLADTMAEALCKAALSAEGIDLEEVGGR